MHSHTIGMYTSNTHAYTYLSTYSTHPTYVCTLTSTYMHIMLVHASLPGAWPQVPTSGRMDKGKLPGPFQTLPQHCLQKKSSRRPEGPDKWEQVQLQWLAIAEAAKVGQLTNSISRPVLVACRAENSQGQCGGEWRHPARNEWGCFGVQSILITEHMSAGGV